MRDQAPLLGVAAQLLQPAPPHPELAILRESARSHDSVGSEIESLLLAFDSRWAHHCTPCGPFSLAPHSTCHPSRAFSPTTTATFVDLNPNICGQLLHPRTNAADPFCGRSTDPFCGQTLRTRSVRLHRPCLTLQTVRDFTDLA